MLDVAAYEAAHQDLERTLDNLEPVQRVDVNPVEVLRYMAIDMAAAMGQPWRVDHASFDAGAAHLDALGIGPLEPLNVQDGSCND